MKSKIEFALFFLLGFVLGLVLLANDARAQQLMITFIGAVSR